MELIVAGQAGLMGKTPFEAACIDMVAEHVRDVRDAQARRASLARGKTDEERWRSLRVAGATLTLTLTGTRALT